jgi:hypothetical protein
MLQLIGLSLDAWGSLHVERKSKSNFDVFMGESKPHPLVEYSSQPLNHSQKSNLPMLSLVSIKSAEASDSKLRGKSLHDTHAMSLLVTFYKPSSIGGKVNLGFACTTLFLSVAILLYTCLLPERPPPPAPVPVEEKLPMLPILKTEWGWCVRGCLEHQGLKVGLCQLRTRKNIVPEASDVTRKHFLREQLVRDLCGGIMDIRQVHPGDLAAAQGDISKLSVSELLHLSLNHGKPGNGPHGDFLRIVENVLYERLALSALKTAKLSDLRDKDDMRRLGREAVLFVAAGAAITTSRAWNCWNWWIGEHRVFFNTATFSCSDRFPPGGVFEFSDNSKIDRFSGRDLDWQVHLVTDERDLAPFKDNQRGKGTTTTNHSEVNFEDVLKRKESLKQVQNPEKKNPQ